MSVPPGHFYLNGEAMPERKGGTNNMPRKRKPTPVDNPGTERKQFNVSFDPAYAARLYRIAGLLGMDPTVLIRMIVRENIRLYEERADKVEADNKTSEAERQSRTKSPPPTA